MRLILPLVIAATLAACQSETPATDAPTPATEDIAEASTTPVEEVDITPGQRELTFAIANTCLSFANKVRSVSCEETAEPTEYACTYSLQTADGSEEEQSVLAQDGDGWTLNDIPEVCAAAAQAG